MNNTQKIILIIAIFVLIAILLVGLIYQNQQKHKLKGYPISSDVETTLQKTIIPDASVSGLNPLELSHILLYDQFGYGKWQYGSGLNSEKRLDLMPPAYNDKSVTTTKKLLNFFAMTDIHITDKESPSQMIYPQQSNAQAAMITSLYSPIMPYTTQVLDATAQTINALNSKDRFDFGISLGDTCNSTQYNETRWYIDTLDGKAIAPSSGAHVGSDAIDYQKPYQAAGLDKSIPWYQTIGNHDQFWLGSFPVNDFFRQSYIGENVLSWIDPLANPQSKSQYYMGVLDGSTLDANIINAGPVENFDNTPKVVADPDRRSLKETEWINEFFNTSSNPVGHGFNLVDPSQEKGFASYSFLPKSDVPIKVIVLDDTQKPDDGSTDIHGHGFLDQARWTWLKKELADGDAAGELMIIAAHIPIGVAPVGSEIEWWNDSQNAVTLSGLLDELHSHPNLLMWIAGHRHYNAVKAFPGPTPEQGFWQVETSSLRDFPQQFRTFQIFKNSDNTISIFATNVDPASADGSLAAKSCKYAVVTQQIVDTEPIYQKTSTLIDFITQKATLTPDTSIKSMFPTGSYNAELVKQLTPAMQAKIANYK